MKYIGHAISEGIGYGKIVFVQENKTHSEIHSDSNSQMEVFSQAIQFVTKQIESDMLLAQTISDSRIVDIFETHKHIVNDPVVLNATRLYINEDFSALDAYQKSVTDILQKFDKVVDPYMLGRIVDIIDATDRVKAQLGNQETESIQIYNEPSILVIKELKPSIIFACDKSNVIGFVSEKGFFDQHSSIIARTLKIPGIILDGIFEIAKEGNKILINGHTGEVFINPDMSIVDKHLERGD